MKKILSAACILALTSTGMAANGTASDTTPTDTIRVEQFYYLGPHAANLPYRIERQDANGKAFEADRLLQIEFNPTRFEPGTPTATGALPVSNDGHALHLLGFRIDNSHYTHAQIEVSGVDQYQLYVDNRQIEGNRLTLDPATHTVWLKCLTSEGEADTLRVRLAAPTQAGLSLRTDDKRRFSLDDVLYGTRCRSVELSADGRYLITRYSTMREGGATTGSYRVSELKSGRTVATSSEPLRWMPRSCRYYYTRKGAHDQELVVTDPATLTETILTDALPEGRFIVGPTEDYLIYSFTDEGPKERKDVYEIVEPDDRQPGWRSRSRLSLYDLNSRLMQPLTHGYSNTWISDLSTDGRYMLFLTSRSRLTARPTTVTSLYKMDLHTHATELLIEKDGFLHRAIFSPDDTQILLQGTPEALDGIGNTLPEGKTPSMTEGELFVMNLADKQIKPITRNFDPSVQTAEWSAADGQIYLTAEHRDCLHLFRIDPADGRSTLLDVGEDAVRDFSLARTAPLLACYGQSASNADRIYSLSTRKGQPRMLEDLSTPALAEVEMGECHPWSFVNQRGDTITYRYYLPPHFDSTRKYPLIVNYYGGCSPTTRLFDTRYPQHAYAALGYVVYVLDPSGATGYGQEFASRHVNTAGQGVADDIIEGTRRFCSEHPFINEQKIGCIGASYGGFMTQYLQTVTDLFAAAVSHAGISDHTSYWGFGYWGYSYSEVSMAGSYPWTRRDLFVDQSPLFRADKIHTPLLFVHGDQDHNVPFAESVQLFTALKLLGRETALVAVSEQDHHISDYAKRIRWQHTIWAWFAKWLQDDDTWWEAMYPKKKL